MTDEELEKEIEIQTKKFYPVWRSLGETFELFGLTSEEKLTFLTAYIISGFHPRKDAAFEQWIEYVRESYKHARASIPRGDDV